MNDPIATLRQQLQQLKTRHEQGTLEDSAYAAAKAPLERKLLDHVMAQPGGTATPVNIPAPRPSWNLVGLLSVATLALSITGYLGFGSPGLPSAGPPGSRPAESAQAPHAMDEEQFAGAVEKLVERLKSEPENADGWAMLARSYVRMGRHADAVPAFEKAVLLVGDDPRLLVDFADALAMNNGRVLEGEPMKLVARALKADPDNAKGLALAGTDAFNRKDYATSVRQWERLAKVAPVDSAFLPQLQSSIDEARSLAGMPAGPRLVLAAPPATLAAAAAQDAAPSPAPGASSAAGAALVTGTVRLTPALAQQAKPDDVVFIFARPAEGSRMPLAILRHQVKDLPVSFRLDDSMAMSPAMKMSQFPKVVVSARISKNGQAAPSAGDLSGQTAPVANTATGLVVEINEVVKN